MEHIDEFMKRYTREIDFFDQVGRLAQARLEVALQEAGIRAIVTSRPKSLTRLRDKCIQRAAETPYASVEHIYQDIVDLVGVRIALYFPGEAGQVAGIVSRLFKDAEPPKVFPKPDKVQPDRRFSGYSATHYRVQLREEVLAEEERRYAMARIEIQVASVLMHAWSEVEHDLLYKPATGALSSDEHAILDQLNGLVLAGEISLERLQEAGQRRMLAAGSKFSNHYDLASYLLSRVAELVDEPVSDSGLGRVDLLYGLLSQLGLTDVDGVAKYVDQIHNDFERRPLSEQLIDALLDEDPDRLEDLQKVRAKYGLSSRDKRDEVFTLAGEFVSLINELEHLLADKLPDMNHRSGSFVSLLQEAAHRGMISGSELAEIHDLRRFRNKLVHGQGSPPIASLQEGVARLSAYIDELRNRSTEPPDGDLPEK